MTEEQIKNKKRVAEEYRKKPENIQRKRELSRIAYLADKEKHILRTKRWRDNNKERVTYLYRSKHLKSKFKMTVEEYDVMFENQNCVCKICRLPSKKKLSIDHNHTTGKIRGLLCFTCNMGIGYFKDSEKLLKSASKYIKEYE